MAIEPDVVGAAVTAGQAATPPVVDANASEYSIGNFTSDRPPDDDICRVKTMTDTTSSCRICPAWTAPRSITYTSGRT
jgi:hypothetical protein